MAPNTRAATTILGKIVSRWVPGLNVRKKWCKIRRCVQVCDVMLVISPTISRGNWLLGRVLEVYPGKDGQERVVKLQVGQETIARPVTKMYPFELEL